MPMFRTRSSPRVIILALLAVPALGAGRARAEALPAWGAEWHSMQRASASFSLLVGDARGDGFDLGRHLLLVRVAPGLGGGRFGLGWAPYAARASGLGFAGVALEAAVLRTWGSHGGVPPGRTYAGAQLHLAFVMKASLGVMKRVHAPTGEHDTRLTWSVGFGL